MYTRGTSVSGKIDLKQKLIINQKEKQILNLKKEKPVERVAEYAQLSIGTALRKTEKEKKISETYVVYSP